MPNTRQLRQKDLEEIYTGPQINSGEKFAQTFTAITITMMYSSGIPLLYLIATISLFWSFWFNKVMLVRWYSRTYEFNEQLPIDSMRFIKFAFLMHFLCGGVQLSKSNILQEKDVH